MAKELLETQNNEIVLIIYNYNNNIYNSLNSNHLCYFVKQFPDSVFFSYCVWKEKKDIHNMSKDVKVGGCYGFCFSSGAKDKFPCFFSRASPAILIFLKVFIL